MPKRLLALVFAAGCIDVPANAPPDAAPDTPPAPDPWTPLVTRTWSIPAGATDTYRCVRVQVPTDTWIAGYKALGPPGTHHTVLTVTDQPNGPVGEYDCEAGTLDLQMLYAAGVGTDELSFPPGVAMRVKAGQYINLNLHLFNVGDDTLAGTSGVLVKTLPASEVRHEADMTFTGNLSFSIPSDGRPHEVRGGCTLPRDWHVFAMWPHMHQHAIHHRVTLDGTRVLLDDHFEFGEQKNYPMDVLLPAGSRLDTVCTYVNNTGVPLTFGDSSNQEMCFTGMYRWPAGGTLFDCAN